MSFRLKISIDTDSFLAGIHNKNLFGPENISRLKSKLRFPMDHFDANCFHSVKIPLCIVVGAQSSFKASSVETAAVAAVASAAFVASQTVLSSPTSSC